MLNKSQTPSLPNRVLPSQSRSHPPFIQPSPAPPNNLRRRTSATVLVLIPAPSFISLLVVSSLSVTTRTSAAAPLPHLQPPRLWCLDLHRTTSYIMISLHIHVCSHLLLQLHVKSKPPPLHAKLSHPYLLSYLCLFNFSSNPHFFSFIADHLILL